MSSSFAFEARQVSKYFGEVKALDDVSLKAEPGTVFGLLGPNGAGKTTLVNMLATLTQPTKGSLQVLGIDAVGRPDEVRNLIGLAGQFAAVDEYLTGEENLYMVGRLYHLSAKETKSRVQKLLADLRLTDVAKRQARTYSGGLRRRLDLGASLVGKPKILFLDEPTTGLDPRTRLELWETIRQLVKEGTSILLTTQYLEEADELADHIAVIDRGKLIAEGTSAQLKAKLGGDVIEFELADGNDRDRALIAVSQLANKKASYNETNKLITVPVGSQGSKKLVEVVRALDQAGIMPHALSLHEPTLDDVFLTLTGATAAAVAEDIKPKKQGRL
ncbi:MAG TPA: ATP-binding cassette domain-containing protein [Candidatus Saccharimonadales bacterium]|nr:ATP-binding cassette domain-containing protein [Candidatus Saccharimonadales bacterium]